MLTRRQFIQVGLAGAAILVAARVLDRSAAPEPGGYLVLDKRTAGLIGALAPVVLAGSLPADGAAKAVATREIVEAFDRAVSGLSPAVQEEIGQLLSLLSFPPTRVALAGLGPAWEDAAPEEIAAFLARWRNSRFDLFRAGYQALTQLLQAAWYDNPLSWAGVGYPGPPALSA